MSFTLSLRRAFVADHFHDLPGFQEDRHGHNWEVEAAVAEVLCARGLANPLLLAGRNPTAEVLAEWALRELQASALRPQWVKIREKANYWALCRVPAASVDR